MHVMFVEWHQTALLMVIIIISLTSCVEAVPPGQTPLVISLVITWYVSTAQWGVFPATHVDWGKFLKTLTRLHLSINRLVPRGTWLCCYTHIHTYIHDLMY